MGERRRQELHRAAGAGAVRRTAVAVAAVVRLDPADRGKDRPVEPELRGGLLVEDEIVGRDVGDVCRGRDDVRVGDPCPVAGDDADRPAQDDERDEGPETAAPDAAEPQAPHPVSGGAYL